MWKRKFLKFILPVAAIGLGAALFTGCHGSHCCAKSPKGKADWVVKKLSNELDLDAGQKAKLELIKIDLLTHRPDFMAWHDSLGSDLINQIRSEKMDKEKMNSILSEKEDKLKEFRSLLVDKLIEFHAILTPVQREKLAAKIAEMKRCN